MTSVRLFERAALAATTTASTSTLCTSLSPACCLTTSAMCSGQVLGRHARQAAWAWDTPDQAAMAQGRWARDAPVCVLKHRRRCRMPRRSPTLSPCALSPTCAYQSRVHYQVRIRTTRPEIVGPRATALAAMPAPVRPLGAQ